jgi:hypothetical protein
MEWGEFLERSDIHTKRWIEDWKRVRLMVAATLHTDPRKVMTLPGDYDEIPRVKSTEQNMEYLKSIGFGYIFNIKGEC